jgi:hypothetical protein
MTDKFDPVAETYRLDDESRGLALQLAVEYLGGDTLSLRHRHG